jgi:hypothetical protein
MSPHIKEKKMQKNTIHPAVPNFQLKKKEKRRREGRKKVETHGGAEHTQPTAV